MRTIATVIARGGSIRLPRKNVRPFCGLPLVAWTIIQAKCSQLIDEVWLSTDDDEIAAIGEEYGAEVVRRPDWPDADTVSGSRPWRHLVETIIATTGDVDCVVSTLPTEPLRVPGQLDRLVARYYEVDDPTKAIHQAIPNRETVLYEEAGDGLRLAVFDKRYRYWTQAGGAGASNPVHSIKGIKALTSDSDAHLDAKTQVDIAAKNTTIHPYITLEVWQQADVDTLDEFKLAEVLMEHYILKGRGRSVYDDYTRRTQ